MFKRAPIFKYEFAKENVEIDSMRVYFILGTAVQNFVLLVALAKIPDAALAFVQASSTFHIPQPDNNLIYERYFFLRARTTNSSRCDY